MTTRTCLGLVALLCLFTSRVGAQISCGFSASDSADGYLQQVDLNYQALCYGGENDTSELTTRVLGLLAELSQPSTQVEMDDRSMESEALRYQVELTAPLNLIDRSLGDSIENSAPPWLSFFSTLSVELNRVLQSISDPDRMVEAQVWQVDNHTLFTVEDGNEPLIDYSDVVHSSCATTGNVLTSSCETALNSSAHVLRIAALVRRVMLIPIYGRLNDIHNALSLLDGEWTYYFEEARSQYPWELALNDRRYDAAPNQLERPPKGQLIFIHPTVAIEYVGGGIENKAAYNTVPIVELLGYNVLRLRRDGPPLKRPIGFSTIASYTPALTGDNVGYGVMIHIGNDLSVGVTQRDTGLQQDTTWLVSVDLGKLFLQKSQETKERFRELEQRVW